ncbi:SusC/RagA family TonB-linked outer membrane protein [Pedobacter sp. LMG 31464]|uniref:SusC/RagA family TonB-linked outer membrane protein n=1 Tax=Pedobacter planticolens TaxID=2679964 RepID=A0A923E043_9SPHI|nr:SusC/RagA family TonB-linked outer membrane protein [Pedobacter planticolens]MBB2145805.1 SusC/RagA family TonB-linked outer membrane protein [Pedobacter planticolens]
MVRLIRVRLVFLVTVCIGLPLLSLAQSEARIQISGSVVEGESGSNLAGVSVRLQSSAVSVMTDSKGRFMILVPLEGDTLVFSMTGYERLKLFSGRMASSMLVAKLEKSKVLLDQVEIINTGFQRLPKERATGSFTLVDRGQYDQQIGINALSRLATISNGVVGVASRVGFFAKDALLVRGMSTYTSGLSKPLVVVDNFEYMGDINNINPNDIESVSILKDAAAGSIWGAKAANGVIVITTKKGKLGQRLKVTASSTVNIGQEPDLFFLREIGSSDLIDLELFLFDKKYRFTDTARSTHPPFSAAYELLFANRSGKLSTQDLQVKLAEMRGRDVRNDFQRYFYQRSLDQQYATSLSGGAERYAWSFSAGLDQNQGNLHERYTRNTIRFSNQFVFSKKLSVLLELSYAGSKSTNGRPSYGSIRPANATLPMYTSFADEQGNALPLYIQYRQGFIDQLGGGKLLDWKYYPLNDYTFINNTSSTSDMNVNVGLDYKLLNWLAVGLKYRYQRQLRRIQTLSDQQSFTVRNQVNNFTQISSAGVVTNKLPKGAIFDWSDNALNAQNFRAQLNAGKNWTDHRLDVIAGVEVSQNLQEIMQDRTYGYNPQTLGFVNVDLTSQYPLLATGGNAMISSSKDFNRFNYRFLSFFSNAAYTYLGRYTLSASARRDASNLFGQLTNDRWKPLWSVGGAWIVSKEPFFNFSPLSELKLRGSYGVQGNVDPNKVALTTLAYSGQNPFTQLPIARIGNYANPELKWEQVGILNLGVDFSVFKGRINGSIEYYHKRLKDMYAAVPVDLTTGIGSSVIRNIGTGTGHGMDIQLSGNYLLGKVVMRHDVVVNTYSDRIVRLYAPPALASQAMSNGLAMFEGYSPSAIFAYRWAGLDPLTGDPRGYLDGAVSSDYTAVVNKTTFADIRYMGTLLPKVFGSVGTGISWKGISLSARLSYKLGYYFRRESISYVPLIAQLSGNGDYAQRWQHPGDEVFTNVPSFVYPATAARDELYRNSEILVERADHIRLQLLSLSYAFDKTGIKKLPFERLQVFSTLSNVGIIWRANHLGLDPDYASLPSQRQFAFGIKLDF